MCGATGSQAAGAVPDRGAAVQRDKEGVQALKYFRLNLFKVKASVLRVTAIDPSDGARAPRADRETSARADDHRALRLWLRLLTCTQLLERHMRNLLRLRFGTTLPRFDLMSRLERYPEGLDRKSVV